MQTWSWTIPYTCLPDVGGINHLQWTLYSFQVPTFRSLNYTVAQKVSLGKDVGLSILLVVYQWLKFPTVNIVRFCDQVPLPRFSPRPKEKGSSYGSPSAQNTSLAHIERWPCGQLRKNLGVIFRLHITMLGLLGFHLWVISQYMGE